MSKTDVYCTNCGKEFEEHEDVVLVGTGMVEQFFADDYAAMASYGSYTDTLCKECGDKLTLQVEQKPDYVADAFTALRVAAILAIEDIEDGLYGQAKCRLQSILASISNRAISPQPNRVVIEIMGAVLSVKAERPDDVVLIVTDHGGPLLIFGGPSGRPIGLLCTVKEDTDASA